MTEAFAEVKAETKEGLEKVDKRFEKVEGEMKAGLECLDDKFDRLHHTLLAGAVVLIAALIWLVGTLL